MFVLDKNNMMGQTLCLTISFLFNMLCLNDVQYVNYLTV